MTHRALTEQPTLPAQHEPSAARKEIEAMRSGLLATLLASSVVLTGCQTVSVVSPRHPYDDEEVLKQKVAVLHKLPQLETQYYDAGTSDVTRQELRDRIVYSLLEMIEEYQRRFSSNLYGRTAAVNTGAEITAAALAGAAALVDASGTSQLLAGLSAFVIGANASVDKNFLQGRGVELIIARMDTLRLERRAIISRLLKNSSVAEYPLGEALLDVQDYARAGSIPAAIQAIAEDNAKAATEAARLLAAN